MSGRYLDPWAHDPAVIALEAVARGLSHSCRFAGQCETLYTAAEHSLLVASRLHDLGHDRAVCIAGLHHDDAEAFIGESTSLKNLLPEIAVVEAAVLTAVVDALGLVGIPFEHPTVRSADAWALAHEAYELMPSRGKACWTADPCAACLFWPLGMRAEFARRAWLRRHRALLDGGVADGR
ncbi:MAG: hydrolase [Solirubrobacteraceae bacterium]